VIAQDVTLQTGDLERSFLQRALESRRVAWDIETTGLDWQSARIGTVQIATSEEIAVVQLGADHVPLRLCQLLASSSVEKVFHHAPFDLRFMASSWRVEAQRVSCTKILSKIIDPAAPHDQHSLKPVLMRYLGVDITKDEQQSDWGARPLRSEQIAYAAADVKHLLPLYEVMRKKAKTAGVWDLATASFAYLPSRARLDLRGSGDVYAY
jgi:ribonuclease D